MLLLVVLSNYEIMYIIFLQKLSIINYINIDTIKYFLLYTTPVNELPSFTLHTWVVLGSEITHASFRLSDRGIYHKLF